MKPRTSSTALLIAASLRLQQLDGVAAARLPAEYLQLAAESLSDAGFGWRFLSASLRWRLVRRALCELESAMLPGLQGHFLLRKERLCAWLQEAHAQGYRQLLVLGAGCDGIGFGFARRGDTDVVELDHPATQLHKRAALLRLNAPTQHMRLLPIDFGQQRLGTILQDSDLSRDLPTMVVAEGLLMYLSPRCCARLCDALLAWCRAPMRFAFSVMQPDAQGNAAFGTAHPWVTRWLAQRGEPFRWAIRADVLPRFLDRRGLRTCAVHDPTAAPEPMLPRWTPCPGEHLVLVQRDTRYP